MSNADTDTGAGAVLVLVEWRCSAKFGRGKHLNITARELSTTTTLPACRQSTNMRLQVALLAAVCATPAAAIFSDEVNHIDFHHALLGAPSPDSTFFLKPSSASNASLLYTLSDRSILGAVNPRDGALVWRHNISQSASPVGGTGILRGLDGNNAVVGAAGDYISSWGAQDGKLIWDQHFDGGHVSDLELLEMEDASKESSDSRDTIALISGKSFGSVRRFDGDSGAVKWEYIDERLVRAHIVAQAFLTFVTVEMFHSRSHLLLPRFSIFRFSRAC